MTQIKVFGIRVLLSCAVLALAGCHPSGSEATLSGEELYRACGACHGNQGQGDVTIRAPAIAGLPKWYVLKQLEAFRTGMRGAHPDDVEGLKMRPMSRQMKTLAEVDAVATYVSNLKAQKPAPTIKGDPKKGQTYYATCMACHGPGGAGNEQLKAPRFNAQADWYLLAQLKKFRAGIRGTMPGDTAGATMKPMAMTLPNDQAMDDVVAYIATLPQ